VNTGNNLVYLTVSALLALMGISGFFGKANISRLSVEVDWPKEVYARTPFPLRVTLRNNRRTMPAFLVMVHIADRTILFPFVDKRSEATRHIDITFAKRGDHVIGNVQASSVFPFNFFTRFTRPFPDSRLLVFPRLTKGDLATAYEVGRRNGGESSSRATGYESEMISIRDYALGDPLKYINWKATARAGRLKTKEFSSLLVNPTVIDFDKVQIDDVEERISRISYALTRLIKSNVPVGLKIGGRLLKPSVSQPHKALMLRALALYPSHSPSGR
jgi:uncharacterized protein (DUF58 family)